MTEYITKEQAIDVVNTAFGHIYDSDSTTVSLVDLQNEIIMTIEQHTEPADIVDEVHARWIEDKCAFMHCSWCGYENDWEWESPYCPSCGARMDGGDKPRKEIPEEYSLEPGAGGWDCSDEEYNYSGYVRDVLNGGR